jgi:hopanoid biosynthesis associated protein HpnK
MERKPPAAGGASPGRRRLIVNADDFGRSASINQAVIRAHREGILRTASLMVNEPSCAEAVALARENPGLGVGLHVSLVCGKSALPPKEIPRLVDDAGNFSGSAPGAGLRFFFDRGVRGQLRAEIAAQFDRFRATGLPLDHVNGHLNLHLHPTILNLLLERSRAWGVRGMRLTCDPIGLNFRLAKGEVFYRLSHGVIFRALSGWARGRLRKNGLAHTGRVFGLLQNGRVDEEFVRALLEELPGGDSELYSHPSLDEFKHEFEALVSPAIVAQVRRLGIELIRYQDL